MFVGLFCLFDCLGGGGRIEFLVILLNHFIAIVNAHFFPKVMTE